MNAVVSLRMWRSILERKIMLVRKNVFNFKELDCSLKNVEADCCEHFFNLIHEKLYKCQDTSLLSDKERILEASKVISFDTNCIKMEFTCSSDDILKVDMHLVKHLDKEASEYAKQQNVLDNTVAGYVTFEGHINNVLEYTAPDGTKNENKDGPTDYSNWSHKIFIKVIEIGNMLYYFYTI